MNQHNFYFKTKVLAVSLMLFIALSFNNNLNAQNKSSKLSSDLIQLSENLVPVARGKQSTTAGTVQLGAGFSVKNLARIIDGKYVIIDAISKGSNKALLKELKKLGLKNGAAYGGMVSGLLPIKSLKALNEVEVLSFASASIAPQTNAGITRTQGDKVQKTYELRNVLGVDGRGITVGTLSDSYNSLGGADSGVVTGDLPGAANPQGYKQEVVVLEEALSPGSDEGRGMMEIIHDVAPGARLTFHSAYNSMVGFAQGIERLAEDGASIINDDIYYYAEPFYQDGIVAQAVEKVVEEYGVTYLSSAGNSGRDSYESKFNPLSESMYAVHTNGDTVGKYFFHDFDKGEGVDIFQKVTFRPGSKLFLDFQWDAPFASSCEGCPGAGNDLDILFALAESPDQFLFIEGGANLGADAIEILYLTYGGEEPIDGYIAIGKFDFGVPTPDPQYVKYIQFGYGIDFPEYGLGASTVVGHSNSKSCIAVGATKWYKTEKWGYNPPLINSYSSVGGTKVIYDSKGKVIKRPKVRKNPDFVAPDGANTTFFGRHLNDGDEFPNFFGTSAAAPHAAATFALLEEIKGEKRVWKSLEKIVKQTAIDMDDPSTPEFDKGYDLNTGYGFINAMAAAKELIKVVGITTLKIEDKCTSNPDKQRAWIVTNPNPFNVQASWELLNFDQSGSFVAKPGTNIIKTKTEDFNLLMLSFIGPWGETMKMASYSHGDKCGCTKSAEDMEQGAPDLTFTSVYPNPVESTLNVEFYTSNSQSMTIKIFNTEGKIVYNQAIQSIVGLNKFNANVENLIPGMYYMSVVNRAGAELGNHKLLKK